MPEAEGSLFVISAPSGAGKTSIVRRLMELNPGLRFSVSYTTRKRRPNEREGIDYYFITPGRFRDMIDAGEFLEHAEVFGHHYGTSRLQVGELLAAGHDVILEIDWQGARQVRRNMPECHSVFILPPSVEELERRLRGRGTDAEEVIRRRLGEAIDDIAHWEEFDHAVINDDLDDAASRLHDYMRHGTAASGRPDPQLRRRINRILESAGNGR